tara:strand:- start:6892 stop:7110 length:219 start_codon:yes stop_codon:yes gene_type:complete
MGNLKKAFAVNWKTTAMAIGQLAVVYGTAIQNHLDGDPSTKVSIEILIASTITALGLIFARDADKSSRDNNL